MPDILEVFNSGMKRNVRPLIQPPSGRAVNLGAGNNPLKGMENLDRSTGWMSPILPFDNESISAVYAFHFLEHLDGDLAIAQLREIERVLEVGGVFTSVTPHWSCELAHQDLDHKSFWSETTWPNLLDNPNYVDRPGGGWRFQLQTCVIMGVVSRNLVVVAQLVRVAA